jgi:hypothetical protein
MSTLNWLSSKEGKWSTYQGPFRIRTDFRCGLRSAETGRTHEGPTPELHAIDRAATSRDVLRVYPVLARSRNAAHIRMPFERSAVCRFEPSATRHRLAPPTAARNLCGRERAEAVSPRGPRDIRDDIDVLPRPGFASCQRASGGWLGVGDGLPGGAGRAPTGAQRVTGGA